MVDDTVFRNRRSHAHAFLDGFLEPFGGAIVHRRTGIALRTPPTGLADDWRKVGDSMRGAVQAEEKKRKAS